MWVSSIVLLAALAAADEPTAAPTAVSPTATAPTATAPTTTTPPAAEAVLLLVLDVGGEQLTSEDRDGLTESLTLLLARRLDLEVQSPRSLLDRANLAATQQQAGCDTSACLAEIANAMGARFIVFSRVVRVGGGQLLRVDVYDSTVGRTVALTSAQAGSVNDLLGRLPGVVEELITESHGELPLRSTTRPIEVLPAVSGETSSLVGDGLKLGGVGLGATLLGGGVAVLSSLKANAIQRVGDEYASAPTIENARLVVAERGSFSDAALSQGSLGGACVGAAGVLAVVAGGGMAVYGWLNPPPAETP